MSESKEKYLYVWADKGDLFVWTSNQKHRGYKPLTSEQLAEECNVTAGYGANKVRFELEDLIGGYGCDDDESDAPKMSQRVSKVVANLRSRVEKILGDAFAGKEDMYKRSLGSLPLDELADMLVLCNAMESGDYIKAYTTFERMDSGQDEVPITITEWLESKLTEDERGWA